MNLEEFTQLLNIGHEIDLVFEERPYFVSYLYALTNEAKKKYASLLETGKRVYYISDETSKTEVYVGDFSGIFEHEFKPGVTIATHPEKFDINCWY
jgi:hypothetical protein